MRHPPPPVEPGAWCVSWAAAVVVTPESSLRTPLLFSRLDEERDERAEVALRDRRAEVGGHQAFRVSGLHVGARIDDRLLHERRERLLRLLRVRHELVEVRPDL